MDQSADKAVTADLIAGCRGEFLSNPTYRLAMNAVCTTPVDKVAASRQAAVQVDHSFSVHLKENSVTAQKGSGRCWIFAALNTLRSTAIEKMGLADDFEFSQNHIMFWDKFEKANYFLECVLSTLDEPVGSRLLDHLVRSPVEDGGQWHMFTALVKKYGVMPKSAMPETESSSSTGRMNAFVTAKLREYACRLRCAHQGGESCDQLRNSKREMLNEVYRFLCIHLGEPPTSFAWQWRDKDKNFHRVGEITPTAFYERFVGVDLDQMVCLVHDPRPGHEFNRTYTVKMLGNVVGADPIVYLNVELPVLKRAAVEQLQSGEPVWFGCDVGKYLAREGGVMDDSLFDYHLVYGTEVQLDKAERLMYGHSQMNHAMVFTGVDLDDEGQPRKWRVENSWSEESGLKGWFQMSDSWMDEYTFEAVVHKRFVPQVALDALELPPVELEPWDPMGSLAG